MRSDAQNRALTSFSYERSLPREITLCIIDVPEKSRKFSCQWRFASQMSSPQHVECVGRSFYKLDGAWVFCPRVEIWGGKLDQVGQLHTRIMLPRTSASAFEISQNRPFSSGSASRTRPLFLPELDRAPRLLEVLTLLRHGHIRCRRQQDPSSKDEKQLCMKPYQKRAATDHRMSMSAFRRPRRTRLYTFQAKY